MKLYSYWRSSCSWRVRIALAYKKQGYEYHAVHLVQDGGHQHKEEHIVKNPMRQVPSLVLDDGTVLNQSLSIIQYLEAKNPIQTFLENTPKEQALVWELAEIINAGTQPLQNLSVLAICSTRAQHRQNGLGKTLHHHRFGCIGSKSQNSSYILRETTVSLADLCLVPQLYNARRFSCDMDRWPTLLAIESRCAQILRVHSSTSRANSRMLYTKQSNIIDIKPPTYGEDMTIESLGIKKLEGSRVLCSRH